MQVPVLAVDHGEHAGKERQRHLVRADAALSRPGHDIHADLELCGVVAACPVDAEHLQDGNPERGGRHAQPTELGGINDAGVPRDIDFFRHRLFQPGDDRLAQFVENHYLISLTKPAIQSSVVSMM